jgi:hypothetical protein
MARCRLQRERLASDCFLMPRKPKDESFKVRCIACLLRLGYGQKTISKFMGLNPTKVAKIRESLEIPANRHRRAISRRKAAAPAATVISAPVKIPITPEQRRAKALSYYYANHEKRKEIARKAAKIRHEKKKKDPEYLSKRKVQFANWKAKNKNKIKELNKLWREKNPERWKALRGNSREKLRKTPKYKIINNLRKRLRDFVSTKVSRVDLFGCTPDQLKLHLESQFTNGMTWANYGDWHIDHIIPCSSFDLKKAEDVLKCCHYTNLQPLWAKDNILKSNKMPQKTHAGTEGIFLNPFLV